MGIIDNARIFAHRAGQALRAEPPPTGASETPRTDAARVTTVGDTTVVHHDGRLELKLPKQPPIDLAALLQRMGAKSGSPSRTAISPDGKQVAYAVRNVQGAFIVKTENPTVATPVWDDKDVTFLRFNKDGTSLGAFCSNSWQAIDPKTGDSRPCESVRLDSYAHPVDLIVNTDETFAVVLRRDENTGGITLTGFAPFENELGRDTRRLYDSFTNPAVALDNRRVFVCDNGIVTFHAFDGSNIPDGPPIPPVDLRSRAERTLSSNRLPQHTRKGAAPSCS